ncbi:Phosphatidate cytidylyltransferase 3 [Bienertia sinuspersici]
MEGLIPFLVRAIKKQNLQSHSYRCLSDSSRRNYHVLGSAGDSVSGSSHRRTQSEFQVPSSLDLQPDVDQFVRSRSTKTTNIMGSNNNNKGLKHIQHNHSNSPAAYNYTYGSGEKRIGSKTINKFHQY